MSDVSDLVQEERRAHPRVLTSGVAVLEIKQKGAVRTASGVIANISLGGVGIYSYDAITVKTSVSMRLHFMATDGTMKSNSARGAVIHIKRMKNVYYMGICFNENLNGENQLELFLHIHEIVAWGKSVSPGA